MYTILYPTSDYVVYDVNLIKTAFFELPMLYFFSILFSLWSSNLLSVKWCKFTMHGACLSFLSVGIRSCNELLYIFIV